MTPDTPIDDRALDSLAVAPASDDTRGGAQAERRDAGQDESIERRLKRDPQNPDARLDAGLDESMDASDPPSSTQPVHSTNPPASSGYDADAEEARKG